MRSYRRGEFERAKALAATASNLEKKILVGAFSFARSF